MFTQTNYFLMHPYVYHEIRNTKRVGVQRYVSIISPLLTSYENQF